MGEGRNRVFASSAAVLVALLVFGLGIMGGCAMGQKYSDSEPNHFDGFVVDIREAQETTYLTISGQNVAHAFDCRYYLANSIDGEEVIGQLEEGSYVSVLYYGRLSDGCDNYAEIVRESTPPGKQGQVHCSFPLDGRYPLGSSR